MIELARAFLAAAAEYFGWRKRVDLTPAEREAQASREKREEESKAIDQWIDSQNPKNPKP
ncbi:hypothetical protein DB346_02820 [Verrucomicrobia bacterium LW23]|nr:hypothetical protein DB346_03835 [Verrucomicrobia bacterium LW23]PTY04381.1 hypothetical protein DB346_02820 [Verrucomicrobia bacterium LW23]